MYNGHKVQPRYVAANGLLESDSSRSENEGNSSHLWRPAILVPELPRMEFGGHLFDFVHPLSVLLQNGLLQIPLHREGTMVQQTNQEEAAPP